MSDLILARALHVLGVVIWIGGVSMITTVALPAVRRGELGRDELQAFKTIERRFVWQARVTVLLVGATGFYMVERLALWARFRTMHFWWMHAMVGVWLLFALVLFIIEPLASKLRSHKEQDSSSSGAALARLQRVHIVLFFLALTTIAGAVAGSHGWLF